MLNMVQSDRLQDGQLTGAQRAWAAVSGLADESPETVLRLMELQFYAVRHGYSAAVEPAGIFSAACVAVVIPWTGFDEMGAAVVSGSRVLRVRTWRGLRAALGG